MSQFKVTASSLNVREEPSLNGAIIGVLAFDEVVENLSTSSDQNWLKVRRNSLIGWSSQKYLKPFQGEAQLNLIEPIAKIARNSEIASYFWSERGLAPLGYINGMAVMFAKAYCNFRDGNAFAAEMAKANSGNSSIDALAYYASQFEEQGMNNDDSGINTLRHLFVLLLGLGMRESSGRWCEGRDTSADNTTSDTAEAGLFQTSWNAHNADPLLYSIFLEYQTRAICYSDIFREGVTPRAHDLENFGSGDGEKFQDMSKNCPAFAVEFAAVALRKVRRHWGPINHHDVELRIEADRMFKDVQLVLESTNICSAFK
jgi:hypothetical protein